jgi:hypothetical protein
MVIVLGMHRSGTSLCSHILSVLGFDMTDEVTPKYDAEKGHWERREVASFHDRILRLLDRDYYSLQHSHALAPGWWTDPRVREIRNDLLTWLRHRMGHSPLFGFKDPRTCRMMPMWKEILAELGMEPRYVFCIRDPRQVGRSITRRDRFSDDDSEYRWMIYNAHAVAAIERAPVCIVSYEDWFVDPASILARLAKHTGAPMRPDEPTVKGAVTDVISAGLRHDDPATAPEIHYLTRELYTQIIATVGSPLFSDSAIQLAEHFVGFEQLMAASQAEAARLRTSLGDVTNELAAARAELAPERP